MLQKNENENAGKKWGQDLEPKRQKNMDLDNSKIISTDKSYCTKEGGKNGLQYQETFLRRRHFFIYYKGGRGTTQPATGTTKHWQFFLNSVCCTGSTKIFLNSVWT